MDMESEKLGGSSRHRGNIPVEEFTSVCPFSVEPEAPLSEVQELMVENKIRHVPVVEQGQTRGIISERDLNLVQNNLDLEKFSAQDIMQESPYEVGPDTSIDEVCYTMSEKKIGSALVVDSDGTLMGIFTATDALNAVVELCRGEVQS